MINLLMCLCACNEKWNYPDNRIFKLHVHLVTGSFMSLSSDTVKICKWKQVLCLWSHWKAIETKENKKWTEQRRSLHDRISPHQNGLVRCIHSHCRLQLAFIVDCGFVCAKKGIKKELNAHWMNSNKPAIIMNILDGILQKLPKNTP